MRTNILAAEHERYRIIREINTNFFVEAGAGSGKTTILVERMARLSVNAQAFLKLGKAAMAARCYDTMAQVLPSDPAPVYNYGLCMQQLGETELAELAFERARELSKTTETEKSE